MGEALSSPSPLPPAQLASQAYRQALIHYRERQALFVTQTWQGTELQGIRPDYVDIANTHLELGVVAALTHLDQRGAPLVSYLAQLAPECPCPGQNLCVFPLARN